MSVLTWVLAGIVVYWVLVVLLRRAGVLPEYVGTQGPILTLHTQRGKRLLERIAAPRRFWRAWSNFGVGIALVVMAAAFVLLVFSAAAAVQNPETAAVREPKNVLVIPGVNDFLPLSVAPEIVAGLLLGLVVHEGGHGILCRVEDIDIDSMGLALFTIIPVGAFVEPDEQSRQRADRGGQTRMFAAGVTNNFAVTLVAFALLFGPVVGSIGVAAGVGVGSTFPGSPADQAGIEKGDRITAVDGTPIEDGGLDGALANASERTVTLTIDGEREVRVERSLFVTAVANRGPAAIGLNQTIVAVNGSSVHTVAGFREAVADREVARVTTLSGKSTFPVGAYARTIGGEPLAEAADLDGGTGAVVVRLDGERVLSRSDLTAVLDETDPGETISVVAYAESSGGAYDRRITVDVTLGDHPREDTGYLGVRSTAGISGLTLDDLGANAYPAEQYLRLLGGGGDDGGGGFTAAADSFIGSMFAALFLPLASVVDPTLSFNFAGFVAWNADFFVVSGPLEFLGGGVFLLANLLFWIGWINLQLGFFNCIPAFPLDGGHILRTSTEAIIARLPVSADREVTRTVTTTVGLAMLVSFVLMVFGQGLLAG